MEPLSQQRDPTTQTTNKLLQLEKDFRYNILLLSERDTLIENYQLCIQKLSFLLIENGIATSEEVETMLRNITLMPAVSQTNKATQYPDSTQPLTSEQCKADELEHSQKEDLSSQLQQFLNLSQSILTDTIDVNNHCHYKNRQFDILVQELQSTNRKVSHLQDSDNNQSNPVTSDKSESQALVQDTRQLNEQISGLQNDLSTQKSIFYSFYRSKERGFLDTKERFVDIESRLNCEIESLHSDLSNLKVESSQSELQYHEQHRDILEKNSKLTKLLFILRDFISNERNVSSHQFASKEQQIAQLSSDVQIVKGSLSIKADDLLVLKRELSESHQKHKSLSQEKRQVELDLLHSYEQREQVMTAAHQSRLENIHIEQQQCLANMHEANKKLIQVEEISGKLRSEREKCVQLIAQDHGSVDVDDNYLPNKIEEILDQNVKLRELVEEMKSTIESLSSSTKLIEPQKAVSALRWSDCDPPLSRDNQLYFAHEFIDSDTDIENSVQIKFQLAQKENEVTQLSETIDGLKLVLSQKDSLINSFHQHFSLLKSFSHSTSSHKLSALSRDTTQDMYNNKMMTLAQRYISLMKEKYRLVEANHKLKLENADLRDKYSKLSTELNYSQSQKQPQLGNPDNPPDGPSTHSHSCFNKPTDEFAGGEIQSHNKDIMSTPNTDNALTRMDNSPYTNNSTLLSFNINNECPDWFNDSNFQRALFYADNPEHIDREFTISTPKGITNSSPIP